VEESVTGGWKVKSFKEPPPPVEPEESDDGERCDHEISWYTREERIVRCALCGQTLWDYKIDV
jgi:hypothetical protein